MLFFFIWNTLISFGGTTKALGGFINIIGLVGTVLTNK